MFKRLQSLSRGQRVLVFVLLFGGAALALAAVTVAAILLIINTSERPQGSAAVPGVNVRQFVTLPDEDSYPASVAVAPDGTVYTGSYVSGTLWRITPDGSVSEIPGTRDVLGAVSGMTVAPDGTLYAVYQRDPSLVTIGGGLVRVTPDNAVTIIETPADTFLLPDDIALDGEGHIYVSDRGRRAVLRFMADGSGGAVWWTPMEGSDTRAAPTGLAYDPLHDALIVTDSHLDTVYRVALDGQTFETLYAHDVQSDMPGFDGVTVTPDGTIYIAALALNRVVELAGSELITLAEGFRGVNDAAYHDRRLYVTNFDSFSLVVQAIRPRLPFALDVIELE